MAVSALNVFTIVERKCRAAVWGVDLQLGIEWLHEHNNDVHVVTHKGSCPQRWNNKPAEPRKG